MQSYGLRKYGLFGFSYGCASLVMSGIHSYRHERPSFGKHVTRTAFPLRLTRAS